MVTIKAHALHSNFVVDTNDSVRFENFVIPVAACCDSDPVHFFPVRCHLDRSVYTEENYIVEYALEYGFLRLSPAMRRRLNITVKLVVLGKLLFGFIFINKLSRLFYP